MLVLAVPLLATAQPNNPFNRSRTTGGGGSSKNVFNQGRKNNFNEYRASLNAEYERMSRMPWRNQNVNAPIKPVKVKPQPPRVMPDDEAARRRNNQQDEGKAIKIDDVVRPKNDNFKVQPIAPIEEQKGQSANAFTFQYLGTAMSVRMPSDGKFRMNGTGSNSVGDVWHTLSDAKYNNMLVDCMKLRQQYDLCDWAYLQMLQALGNAYLGKGSNEAVMLTAFVYSQSGYKLRLAEVDGRLEMLFASQHNVYDKPYVVCDGDKFYSMNEGGKSIKVNSAKFPKERSLSLWVPGTPEVKEQPSAARTLTAKSYADMTAKVSVNKNLLDFYSSYPTSEVGGNFMTRWAMYANTPMCASVKTQLYPALRRGIQGKSQRESVERLLNWVQTAFIYEYDDKVWGGDRAFFAEESLHYPYCDCEDRSILFTRLVRDLLGLKCVLVYYPGHLASAVQFTDSDAIAKGGDYINVNGSKFIIADPTYIGATVGATMPDMDNASAKVILLQ